MAQEAKRRLDRHLKQVFYEERKLKAQQYASQHKKKLRFRPEQVHLLVAPDEWRSLNDMTTGSQQRLPLGKMFKNVRRIEIRIPQPESPEALFALYRQIECYCALHVHPALHQELLPQNKALFDDLVKVLALQIGYEFEALGFVNPSLSLDAIHPENGRQFSRILSVQRPSDPSKVFQDPGALGA